MNLISAGAALVVWNRSPAKAQLLAASASGVAEADGQEVSRAKAARLLHDDLAAHASIANVLDDSRVTPSAERT